jgi:multidrug resistance efflux pump
MYRPQYNCFRQDLIITSIKKQGTSEKYFLIKDPHSGETFEFGEGEYFLCRLMDGKLTPSKIITAFQEKFQLELTENDFEEFASLILDYGLLETYQPQKRQELLPENPPTVPTVTNRPRDQEGLNSSKTKTNKVTESSPLSSQTQSKKKKKAKTEEAGLVLCNPSSLLKFFAQIFSPLSFLVWLILPCVTLAFFTVIHNQFSFWNSLVILWERMNPLLAISISLVTLNLASEIAQGIVFSSYGGVVKSLEIKPKMGFFPLFSVNLQGIKRLSRKNQLWIFATPLLTRIFVCSLGILIWKMIQTNETQLEIIILFLVQSSVIGLVVDSSPFWDSNGYRWFSIYFNLPRLFEKTLRVWDTMLSGRPFPKTLSSKEKLSLQIYACVLILSWGILFIWLGTVTAILLEKRFQGVGVVIFLILIALILRWYLAMNSKSNSSQGQISEQNNNQNIITQTNDPIINLNHNKFIKFFQKNYFTIFTLIGIAVILCLPYRYRPGGSIQLLPPKQQNIQADISGKITQVFFQGGDDTWVKKGEVIAIMQASRQLNPATPIDSDILVIQEQIKNQKAIIETKQAQLDKLLSTPRTEDIKFAQTGLQTAQEELMASQQRLTVSQRELDVAKNSLQVAQAEVAVAIKSFETAKIQADFRTTEALRYKELSTGGAVSLQDYEDKEKLAKSGRSDMAKEQETIQVRNQDVAKEQKNVQVAIQKVEEQKQNIQTSRSKVQEKQANLELVLSGPNPNEIAAARQEVEAAKATLQATKQQLLSVRSQLEGKNLLMPFDGYIATPFLDQKVNTYLEQGTTFAVAEDNRNIQGQMNVPETDVGLFEIGQEVEVKLAAYPNLSLTGKIISIEPATEETDQGKFVQIVIKLPNSQKSLKSGMSGYGKIEGITMPVIVAFTRPIVRFIQIEIWSWIP